MVGIFGGELGGSNGVRSAHRVQDRRHRRVQSDPRRVLAKISGARMPTRATQGRDRDNTGTYIHIVEFPSYEAGMENSNRPETAEFAAQLAKICDGPPTFRNLDVVREEEM